MNDLKHIEAARTAFYGDYLARWQAMIDAWRRPAASPKMWLMYAANYLFNTGGVRWALDPLRPNRLLPDLPVEVPTEALRELSFVLLTHSHTDHYDPDLLRTLSGSRVRFVVPEPMLEQFDAQVHPDPDQIVVARSGSPLTLDGVRIEPFNGWHWAQQPDGRRTGMDATGYRVWVAGAHWLFPGDVRTYRPDALKPYAPVDCLFAHLWLGRGCALIQQPPLCQAFVDFVLACRPRTLVLSHLYELSRQPEDMWHRRHADMIRAHDAMTNASIRLLAPAVGDGLAWGDEGPQAILEPSRVSRVG